MHHSVFKSITKGLISVFIASTPLFSDFVIDSDFDDNKNDFGYCWYYYDDTKGIGKDDRLQSTNPGTPSLIRARFEDSTRSDGKTVKNYTFATGEQCCNKFATLPFVMGSTWVPKTYSVEASPFVGIGTRLANNGQSIDLRGIDSIKFKIRSHQGKEFSVRFEIQTLNIDKYSEVDVPPSDAFAYHGVDVENVTTSFTEHTFSIPNDFKQPQWVTTKGKFAFDPSQVTRIEWKIYAEPGTIDTLDIDDVTFISYNWNEGRWSETVPLTPLPTTGEFATFDKINPSETPLGTKWYAFSDLQIGGTTNITKGAVNQNNGRYELQFSPKTGSSGATHGAAIDFTFGPNVVTQDSITMRGYAGIRCDLYDSAKCTYWNAQNARVQSIYFHYLADATRGVTLEFSDFYDVADANRPTNKNGRGRSNVVWYVELPSTDSKWKAVQITFSKLVCSDYLVGSKNIPLDITRLARIQWKVEGYEGKNEFFAIDNVFFPQTNCQCPPETTDVKYSLHFAERSPIFNVKLINGSVHISFNNNVPLKHGTISFFNALGSLIQSTQFLNSNNFATNLPDNKFHPGVYFVKMKAVDINGQKVIGQSSIIVAK